MIYLIKGDNQALVQNETLNMHKYIFLFIIFIHELFDSYNIITTNLLEFHPYTCILKKNCSSYLHRQFNATFASRPDATSHRHLTTC